MTQHNPIPLTVHAPNPAGGARATAGAALGHAHPPAPSLYIHTPFCVHKCHYCDFYSFVDSRDQQAAFVERLALELRALAAHAARPISTIFVGGGTPSLLRVDQWRRLLSVLHTEFDLSALRDAGEFTVECNPESATPDLLGVLCAGGVNRVSLGAQSFNPAHLKTLERWHDPDNVARAVEAAHAAGIARTSIDLIYAIPGQTLDEWDSDLSGALALGTTHLSCYNLTYEPNTAMTVRLKRGEFAPIDEDLEADMFEHTGARLAAAGLERYEVSNYARPGHECLHNLAYWRQDQWLAAGPSASGHVWAGADRRAGGHRWKNTPSLGVYLDHPSRTLAPIQDYEPPDPARAIRERIMTGVRLREGVSARTLLADAEHAAPGSAARLHARAARLHDEGLLDVTDEYWLVRTPRAWLLADWIAKELMGEVVPRS